MAFTALTSLTRHWDTGAQIILSPNWWLDDNATPTWARANATMARIVMQVTNTTTWGLRFGTSCYSATNVEAVALLPRPGGFAIRAYEVGGAETPYSFTHPSDPGDLTLVVGLDTAKTYWIEFEIVIPADARGGTLTPSFETMRQIENVGAGYEGAAFTQVEGVIADAGAVFNTVNLTAPVLKVLIHGDSISGGITGVGAGTPNTSLASPATAWIVNESSPGDPGSDAPATQVDQRGSLMCVQRRLVEEHARAKGKRFIILNLSFPGAWQGIMGPVLRDWYETGISAPSLGTITLDKWMPGLFADIRDRLTYRTNEAATDWASGSDWTGGTFVPDVIFVGTFTNDIIQHRWAGLIDAAALAADEADYFGAEWKDNTLRQDGLGNSTLRRIQDLFPNAKTVVVYGPAQATGETQFVTFGLGGATVVINQGTDVVASMKDGVYPYYDVDGLDRSHMLFLSMYALRNVSGASDSFLTPHPNVEAHEVYRSAWQEAFDKLIDGSTGSQIVGENTTVDDFPGIVDTFIDFTEQAANNAADTDLQTRGSPTQYRRSLMRVDLSNLPAFAQIISVEIGLRSFSATGGGVQSVFVHEMLQKGWVAAEANWTEYALGQTWDAVGAEGSADVVGTPSSAVGAIASVTSIPVTWHTDDTGQALVLRGDGLRDLFQRNLGGSADIMLSADVNTTTRWRSSEGTDGERPRVRIRYSLPSRIINEGALTTVRLKASDSSADSPVTVAIPGGDADNQANRIICVKNRETQGAVQIRGESNGGIGEWITLPADTSLNIQIPAGTGKRVALYAPRPLIRTLPKPNQPIREVPMAIEISRA